MTSILQARDELGTALAVVMAVADVPGQAAPPCAVIFGEGAGDLEHIGRGQLTASFRITLLSGGWDLEASGRVLTGLVQSAIGVVLALPSWRLDAIRRDTTIDIAGGRMLGADVIASRMVDIS
jgi:hypothetical protein